MDPQSVIDLGREAVRACLMVGGPVLLVSLVVGLVISVFQAMTQIQDQTVAFVPKLICLILAIGLGLPWLTSHMVDYSRHVLAVPLVGSPPLVHSADRRGLDVMDSPVNQTAVQRVPQSRSESKANPANPDSGNVESDLKSPFSLPHYRFTRIPKTNIDG